MKINPELLTELVVAALKTANDDEGQPADQIPLGISNRHIHLSEADLAVCFGPDYQLDQLKDLSQPGQYAAAETMTVCGPKGAIEKVRVLAPVRGQTQVEILASDCFKLGIKPYVRLSGDLAGSAPVTVVGPKGSVSLKEGAIVAKRHIHMTPEDAARWQVQDGQTVSIRCGSGRGGSYDNVMIRVTKDSALECHLDTEEANAMGLTAASQISIIA